MPIRLLIFDLDGTLVDSILDTTNAVNYALGPCGLNGLSPAKVSEMISLSSSATVVFCKIFEEFTISGDVNVAVERYLKYYSAHLTDTTVPYPGIIETLEALKGYQKAIVTNKGEEFAVKVLNSLGLSTYFDMIVGGDTGQESKPSPMPIFHVLKGLDIGPEHAIIVGDSKSDIDCGRASGLKTVAVTYGYGDTGFQEEADFVITRISGLLEIVKNIP